MQNTFNEDDEVVFKDSGKQVEYASKYITPFKIHEIKVKDFYATGLPKDYWEKFVDLVDSKGEIFI